MEQILAENQQLRERLSTYKAEVEARTEALQENEERMALAFRGANDGLWDWNLQTDEVFYSYRWKNMLGYEDNELENNLNTWASLVHPDDKDRVLQLVEDYLSGKADSFDTEFRMLHKDGHELIILSRAIAQFNESDGKPLRLVGTHVDITDRKRDEEHITRTAKILEMIAMGLPTTDIYDAIALMYEARHPGMRCSMLTLSKDGKLLHGGAPSLPKEYCEAVHGLQNGPDVGSCGTSTYTGKRCLVENIDTDPKWANIKHVALPHGMRCCWSEPIKNSSGLVLGAFGMYYNHPALPDHEESEDLKSAARLAGIVMERDYDQIELEKHRLRLEELVSERTRELEAARQESEKANKAKSAFLANMSHEFRTPMNGILGFGQLLLMDENLSDRQRSNVGEILSAGENMLSLVNEILDLAKIEAGKVTINFQAVECSPIIDECLTLINKEAELRGISIERDLQDSLITFVDTMRLKQVLINLFSNATKYNVDGGNIHIRSFEEEGRVCIEVSDTGVGIARDDMSLLFEPFKRLDNAGSHIEGTGIGLTLTKQILDLMNGGIEVQSEIGKGSTFRISLPQVVKKPVAETV